METKEKNIKKFNWFSMFWSGFTSMSKLGKILWTVVIIKLIIMFVVLKPNFFPNFLNSRFKDKEAKAEYVGKQLTNKTTEYKLE